MRTIVTDLIVATPFALCLALILWWAWWQETASRYADGLDRRFAKYLTKPQLHRQPEPLKAYLDWVDWREMAGKCMELQENINPQVAQSFRELEQRVTALEKDNRWHRTAAELLMNLEPRLAEVENVMNQIHKLNPPLPLPTDSLPDTETPAEQGSTKTLSYSELFPASQGGTPKP